MIAGIVVNAEAMRTAAQQGFATATDLADYLVKKGLAFRDAHEAAARAVRDSPRNRDSSSSGCRSAELRRFSEKVGSDVYRVLTLEGSVAGRSHIGGTAPSRVRAAVRRARAELYASGGAPA